MRVKSVLVLLAVVFSVLSPLSVHLTIAHGHGHASIETFDICHAGSLALSTSHMTWIHEPLYRPAGPVRIAVADTFVPRFKPLLTALQEDHPPKI